MKKRVIYLQEDSCSCGACSIQSIVSYYGGYVPLEAVLDDTNTTSLGTNAYELTKALKKYGFSSYGRKMSLNSIDTSLLPVIAHVVKDGLEHFLVIYEIEKNYVLTMDPECGERKYSRDAFESMSDDTYIFAHKTGSIPRYKSRGTLLTSLLKIFKSNKGFLATICVLYLLILIISLSTSFHFKFLEKVKDPIKITLLFVLMRVVLYVLSILKDYLTSWLVIKIDVSLTSKLTHHIFHLPMRFLLRKKTGELVKKIGDTSFVKDLVLRIFVVNTIDLIMIICSSILIFKISSKLAIIYLLIAICLAVTAKLYDKNIYKKNKENVSNYDEYMGILVEHTACLESMKNLNSEKYSLDRIETTYKKYSDKKRKFENYINLMENTKMFVKEIGLLVVNLIGFMNLDESFTMYDLITIGSLFGLFISSLESILSTSYHLTNGRALYKSSEELLDLEEEKSEGTNLIGPLKNIQIEDLCYSYDGIHMNIDHFVATIEVGQKILVTGPSGVGKSTLVKCICGMQDDYTGRILINGLNVKDIPKRALRDYVLYVGQEEKLFSGTIKENIVLGQYDERIFEEVINFCSLEGVLASRIERENSTILESASNLSGGERSRMILARALYRRPRLLIIDETLSSVSEEMEDEILKRLLAIENLTVIYITHRKKEHLFQNIIKLERNDNNEFRKQ